MKLKLVVIMLISGLFGYSGYWFYISGNTDVFLEMAQEDLARQGVTFEYSAYEVSGFPYRLVLTFENPKITYQNGGLEFDFVASRMEAIAQPWNIGHVILFPEEAVLNFGDVQKDQKSISLKPTTIGISINSIGEGYYRVSSEMTNVEVTSNTGLGPSMDLTQFSIHLRNNPEGGQNDDTLLEPKILDLAFAGTTARNTTFQMNTSFRGKDIPHLTELGLAKWRDQGGTLELDLLKINSTNYLIDGSGSITLDADLYPLGSVTLESPDGQNFTDFFLANNWINETEALFMNAYLSTLPKSEGNQNIQLVFTLQDGSIFYGPFRLRDTAPVIQE